MRRDNKSIANSFEFIHYSHVVAVSGLGEGEIPKLNIASLLKALTKSNLLIFESVQAVLSKVKVLKLEGYPTFASKYGLHHCRDGVCTTLNLRVISRFKREVRKRSKIIRFKVDIDQPKGSERILLLSSGLPTEYNCHGNRVAIVPSNKLFITEACLHKGVGFRTCIKIKEREHIMLPPLGVSQKKYCSLPSPTWLNYNLTNINKENGYEYLERYPFLLIEAISNLKPKKFVFSPQVAKEDGCFNS